MKILFLIFELSCAIFNQVDQKKNEAKNWLHKINKAKSLKSWNNKTFRLFSQVCIIYILKLFIFKTASRLLKHSLLNISDCN